MVYGTSLRQDGLVQRYLQILSCKLLFFLRFLGLGVCLLLCFHTALADTPRLNRSFGATGCYCNCAMAKSCTKMCDSKKRASQQWTKTCMKPHLQTPPRDSHAGPRFSHPGRAEYAQL